MKFNTGKQLYIYIIRDDTGRNMFIGYDRYEDEQLCSVGLNDDHIIDATIITDLSFVNKVNSITHLSAEYLLSNYNFKTPTDTYIQE